MKKGIFALMIIGIICFFWFQSKNEENILEPEPIPVVTPDEPKKVDIVEDVISKPVAKEPPKKKIVSPSPLPNPVMEAPKVEIFQNLIPENIEIIRVYYSQPMIGPGLKMGFDINGSGFNQEFEKMISVKSGSPHVQVSDFRLVTPNQIRGTLVISEKAPTSINFPQVLIQDKVVFQAPEPYGVIREGEVLNLIFVEMEDTGRAGKFRVFTNLTESLYDLFKVIPSTDGIEVGNLVPNLPYSVDGMLRIGWTVPMGKYDLKVYVRENVVWEGKEIIRIVKPNVGQSGLAQRLKTEDGFHRPGDEAEFEIHGSGFRPEDATLLTINIGGLENFKSSFTYIAPGRMGLVIDIPKKALVQAYELSILQGETNLLTVPNAFNIVDKNWTRDLQLNPPLSAGMKSTLILRGRDLQKKFVEDITVETDDPGVVVGAFKLESAEKAIAQITIGPSVSPGDYWLRMSSSGQPVEPQFGSIVRVN